MQISDGLIVLTICLVIQTMVQLGYFILEIVRDGKDHAEADQADALPDDTEWETRA